MKIYKRLFIALLTLNVVALIFCGVFIYKKGGVTYFLSKFKTETVNAKYIQRESLFSDLELTNDDIVFLGDSITQRCEWTELLNNPKLRNRGIDGDSVKDVLNRLDSIIQAKPSKVFLMVGINDVNKGGSTSGALDNYEAILKEFKEKCPETKVYVQSLIPLGEKMPMSNDKVKEFNKSIEELAKKFNYDYVDIFSKMTNAKGDLKEELSKDGIHLMGEGYEIWKGCIEQYIN